MPIETTWGEFDKKDADENKLKFKKEVKTKWNIKSKKELEEKVRLMLQKNLIRKYEYEEDSFNPSVEPKYFWVIDFLKTMRYKVKKHWEKMGASVVSQFFGEMSTRRQFLERRGMEIMSTVNTVVKTIINLLYDLRELDRRLKTYDQLESKDPKLVEAADASLKRVWMDEVDTRKGGASINAMSQKGLEFITLRDAFMIAKSAEEVDKLEVNDRVKRILTMRLDEYLKWRDESNGELHMRKRVERAYLKSEVDSLKLYSQWARPYLKAAQRLQFEDVNLNDTDLIQAFDQNFIEIKVRGTSEIRLKQFFKKAGQERDVAPPESWPEDKKEAFKNEMYGPPVYSVMDVTFTYRTKPALVSQTQGGGGAYRYLGKLNIKFESYLLTPEEFNLLEKQEDSEALDFIEGMTKESLDAMKKDINEYLDEEDSEEKAKEEKKKGESKPLLDQWFGKIGEKGGLLGGLNTGIFDKAKLTQRMAAARAKVADHAFNIYDIFKKAHGMLSFPYYPSFATPPASK